jgi:hypothetical protein
MDALRCLDCGDTRWSLRGFGGRFTHLRCELCGGAMVPERRKPNHGAAWLAGERRDRSLNADVVITATRPGTGRAQDHPPVAGERRLR